jgi:hypothetical protein
MKKFMECGGSQCTLYSTLLQWLNEGGLHNRDILKTWRNERHMDFFFRKSQRRDNLKHLKDLDLDEKIILKRFLQQNM